MKTISIIQPDEFGSDFLYEDGVWKVKFPPGKPNIDPASKDAGNAVTAGTDGGAYLSEAMLCAYALTQDNVTKKIYLYQFPVGTIFDPETATLVSTVNMVDLQAVFDDVAIDGTVLTFTDADTGQTMSIDTAQLQRISDIQGGLGIEVGEMNGVVTPIIKIASPVIPDDHNLVEGTDAGLLVGGGIVGEAVAAAIDGNSLNDNIYRYDAELNVIRHNVNGNELQIPQIKILNSKGELVGLIDDLEEGVTQYSVETPLDYSPFR